MRKFTKSVVALAIAAMPMTMSAQTATTFTLPSSFVGFGGVASGGFMATATIGGLTGMWSVFCIDDNHGIALVPTPIEVFATEILSTSDFSKTRLNSATSVPGPGLGLTSAETFARYTRAQQFAAAINMANGDDPFNRTQQVAMWDVTDNGVNPTSAAQSVAAVNTGSFRAFVLSGRNGTAQNLNQQELIAIQPTVVVPEPSTYAMLATGLVMFGVVARRRRQA